MANNKMQCSVCRGFGKMQTGPIVRGGNGKLSYSEIRKDEICKACKGKGYFLVANPKEWEKCAYCEGHGWIDGNYCRVCKGLGKVKLDVF